jgi:heme exporter protein B
MLRKGAEESMSRWQTVGAIVWKEVVVGWRAILSARFALAVLVILISYVVFKLRAGNVRETVTAAVWMAVTVSGMLSLSCSFVQERARGSLDGLLLSPVDRGAIYLAKWLSNWLFISLVQAVTLPLASALFGVDLIRADLLLIMALGTGGYAGVGTLLSAMASNARTREMLLPVMLLPVAMPLLLAAVKTTSDLLHGETLTGAGRWLQFMVGFNLILVILSSVLFDYAVRE